MTSLAQYVGAPEGDDYPAQCEQAARTLLSGLIGDQQVPDDVYQQALLEVGANLYQRREAVTGTTAWDSEAVSSTPWRPARDPLTPARGILAPYLGHVGIA